MCTINISILVPVYNVETYLPRCIESVLSQDFTNYELILVDDGSTDKSGKICEKYAFKYPQNIKLIHQRNSGSDAARLTGFQKASGKYVMFLDSDDYLLPNALTILYSKIEEGYDIVKGINRRVYSDGSYTIERHRIFNEEVIGNENYLSKVINAELAPYLWGGLYRKNVIQEDDFKQILSFTVGEDWLLNIAIARRVNKMICIDKEVYCYFINNNSIMQSKVCSYEYGERMKTVVESLTYNYGEEIKFWVKLNQVKGMISNFFIPELKPNSKNYSKLISYLKDKRVNSYVKKYIDRKFIFCIQYKYLFFLYSFTYRILFKALKLSFKKRKLIS